MSIELKVAKKNLRELLYKKDPEKMTRAELKLAYWLVVDYGVKKFMKEKRSK